MLYEVITTGFDTAAVEDAGVCRNLLAELFLQQSANKGVYLLGLFIGGSFAGADCPYWLIGHNHIGHRRGAQPLEAKAHLAAQHVEHLLGLALLQGFANTEDHTEPGFDESVNFLIDKLVTFAEQLATFVV